jgi:hypothetical protein
MEVFGVGHVAELFLRDGKWRDDSHDHLYPNSRVTGVSLVYIGKVESIKKIEPPAISFEGSELFIFDLLAQSSIFTTGGAAQEVRSGDIVWAFHYSVAGVVSREEADMFLSMKGRDDSSSKASNLLFVSSKELKSGLFKDLWNCRARLVLSRSQTFSSFHSRQPRSGHQPPENYRLAGFISRADFRPLRGMSL